MLARTKRLVSTRTVQGDVAKGTQWFLSALAPDKAGFSSLSVPMFSFLVRMLSSQALLHLLSCPIPAFGCPARPFPRTVPFPKALRSQWGSCPL